MSQTEAEADKTKKKSKSGTTNTEPYPEPASYLRFEAKESYKKPKETKRTGQKSE